MGFNWDVPWYPLVNACLMACDCPRHVQVRYWDGSASMENRLGERRAVGRTEHEHAKALLAMAQFGLNADFDSWDGYPAARDRFVEVLQTIPGGRAAVYAGDSHAAWAGHLVSPANGRHAALEFDGTSVSSSGPDTWMAFLPPPLLEAAYVSATAHLDYADTNQRGWMEVSVTHQTHSVAFLTVSTVGSRDHYTVGCDAAFEQLASEPHVLRRVACPPTSDGGEGAVAGTGDVSTAPCDSHGGAVGPLVLTALTGVLVGVGGTMVLLRQQRLTTARSIVNQHQVEFSSHSLSHSTSAASHGDECWGDVGEIGELHHGKRKPIERLR